MIDRSKHSHICSCPIENGCKVQNRSINNFFYYPWILLLFGHGVCTILLVSASKGICKTIIISLRKDQESITLFHRLNKTYGGGLWKQSYSILESLVQPTHHTGNAYTHVISFLVVSNPNAWIALALCIYTCGFEYCKCTVNTALGFRKWDTVL